MIKHLAVAAFYSKPKSKMKTKLLDHIAETFNYLKSKYGDGLHFIIAGDSNDLKLDSILNLSPQLKQTVQVFTRHNPDKMLDPIITTLSTYYQPPEAKPPLDPDPDKNGEPADHNIVIMRPITNFLMSPARISKEISFRPLPQSGIDKMGQWITSQSWLEIYNAETAHEKAELLQNLVMTALETYLPKKTIKVTSDDKPWITSEVK